MMEGLRTSPQNEVLKKGSVKFSKNSEKKISTKNQYTSAVNSDTISTVIRTSEEHQATLNSSENKENVTCNFVENQSQENNPPVLAVCDVTSSLSNGLGDLVTADETISKCKNNRFNVSDPLEEGHRLELTAPNTIEKSINEANKDRFSLEPKNMECLPMTQSTQQKRCSCGHQKARLSLNIGKLQANSQPTHVYANGEPMDTDERHMFGLGIRCPDQHKNRTLKKWDSFEVLENWCEKSLLESEKGGLNDNGADVNYFKDLVEYVEENGIDICTDKEEMEQGKGDGVFGLRRADSFEMLEKWCDMKVKSKDGILGSTEDEMLHTVPNGTDGTAITGINTGTGFNTREDRVSKSNGQELTKNNTDIIVGCGGSHGNINNNAVVLGTGKICDETAENCCRMSPVNGCTVDAEGHVMISTSIGGKEEVTDCRGQGSCSSRSSHTMPQQHTVVAMGDSNNVHLTNREEVSSSKTCVTQTVPDILISPVYEGKMTEEVNFCVVNDSISSSNGCLGGNSSGNTSGSVVSLEGSYTKCENTQATSSDATAITSQDISTTFQPLVFRETNFIPSVRFLGSPSVPDIPESLSVLSGDCSVCDSDSDLSKSTSHSSHSSPQACKAALLSDITNSLKTGSTNSLNSFTSDFSDLSKDLSQSMVFQEPNFSRGILNTGHVTPRKASQSRSSSQPSPSSGENSTRKSNKTATPKRASKREIVDNDVCLNKLSYKLQKLSVDQSQQSLDKFKGAVSTVSYVMTSVKKKVVTKDTNGSKERLSYSPGRCTPIKKSTTHNIPSPRSKLRVLSGSPLLLQKSDIMTSSLVELEPSRNKGSPVGQVFKKISSDSTQRNNRLQKYQSSPSLYNRTGSPIKSAKKTTTSSAEFRPQLNRQATPRFPARPRSVALKKEKPPTLTFDDTDSTTTDDTDISEAQEVLIEKQRQQVQSLRQEKRRLHSKLRSQVTGSPRCCSPVPSSPVSPVDDFTCVRFKDAEAVPLRGPELEAVTKLYTLCNGQQQAKIIKQATAPMIFNATVCELKEASRVKWPDDRQMVQHDQPSVLHDPPEPQTSTQARAILKPNEASSPFPYFDEPFLPIVVRKLPKWSTPAQMDPSKM